MPRKIGINSQFLYKRDPDLISEQKFRISGCTLLYTAGPGVLEFSKQILLFDVKNQLLQCLSDAMSIFVI
jgi:hypothetical protein